MTVLTTQRGKEGQGGREFSYTQISGKIMYNPLTESPLNLLQTFNIQNIPKLKVILMKAEGIKFCFATRVQHII